VATYRVTWRIALEAEVEAQSAEEAKNLIEHERGEPVEDSFEILKVEEINDKV